MHAQRFVSETAAKSSPYPTAHSSFGATRQTKLSCDESAFFKDDKLVFYNVLYPMLSTTDGTLVASSTPWSKDSVYYRMCQAPEFSKHTVTCEDVVKAGLIKQSFIDEMRSSTAD